MSEQLAVMPLSDWQDIVDSVREKTGKTETLVSGEVASEIDGISRGINPEWTDWRNFSYSNNRNDLIIQLKYNDTSNGTNFAGMFESCSKLTTIPSLDTSNGTNFANMFNNCYSITTIPSLDTSNGTNFANMFSNCLELVSVGSINLSSGASFANLFLGCSKLKNIKFEGFIPVDSDGKISLQSASQLTIESLMSFINALKNTGTSTYKVTIGSTNLAKLTPEQIQIATDKNITLA